MLPCRLYLNKLTPLQSQTLFPKQGDKTLHRNDTTTKQNAIADKFFALEKHRQGRFPESRARSLIPDSRRRFRTVVFGPLNSNSFQEFLSSTTRPCESRRMTVWFMAANPETSDEEFPDSIRTTLPSAWTSAGRVGSPDCDKKMFIST
jgi:hypothetical protein